MEAMLYIVRIKNAVIIVCVTYFIDEIARIHRRVRRAHRNQYNKHDCCRVVRTAHPASPILLLHMNQNGLYQ